MLATAYIISHMFIILGLYGLVIRKDNLIISLVNLETALLGVALQFSTSGLVLDDFSGQLIFFLILTFHPILSNAYFYF